jgi:DNA-binding LacI/PurR family transcriptional regulator
VGRLPRYQATLAVLRFQRRGNGESHHRVSPYSLYLTGMQARAKALGFKLEEFSPTESGMTPARLAAILRHRGISGVLVPPLRTPGDRFEFAWDEFSAVALGYSLTSPRLHRACADIFSATGLLLEKVVSRGYRRIGMALFSDADNRVQHLALARFLAWQRTETTTALLPALLLGPDTDPKTFRRWLQAQKPDVILSNGPEIAQWLKEAKLHVPREVGVATTFWLPDFEGLSGVYHDFPEVGAAAVELLVSQLHRNERGIPESPRLLLIRSRWVEGRTLRPRPSSTG